MRTQRSNRILLAAVCALVLSGCVGTSAPRKWLPSVQAARSEAFGAWTELNIKESEEQKYQVRGELIAVHDDSIFVWGPQGLAAYGRDHVTRVKLTTYRPTHGGMVLWTFFGSLSTVSHGVGLLISFPVWVIGGSAATASVSGEPDETCPESVIKQSGHPCWEKLSKFARFPQGLPPTLDRTQLTGKTLSDVAK